MTVIEALERAVGGTNCDDVAGQLRADGLAVADEADRLARGPHADVDLDVYPQPPARRDRRGREGPPEARRAEVIPFRAEAG